METTATRHRLGSGSTPPIARPGLGLLLLALLAGCQVGGTEGDGDDTSDNTTPVYRNVSAAEADQLIADHADDTGFVILDVRTAAAFAAGHLAGAVNLDYYADDFRDRLDRLDKAKTYLVYCASGGRSGSTMTIMEELGFQTVYNLTGGLSAWTAAGYPTTTD